MTSKQMNFASIPSATSLQALEDGRTRSSSPDGQKMSPYGPAPVHANRFRAPADSLARKMNGTSGQNSIASSASADLQRSLGSRLRAMMDLNGSMEYRLTWKSLVMPSDRVISRLRASAHLKNDSAFSGWRTPGHSHRGAYRDQNKALARLRSGHQINLEDQVVLAGWGTPTLNDNLGSAYMYGQGDHSKIELKLPGQARVSGIVGKVSGRDLILHPAWTEKSGGLNPNHSRWLMGFPKSWHVAYTAMQSSPKSRQSSLRRSCKQSE